MQPTRPARRGSRGAVLAIAACLFVLAACGANAPSPTPGQSATPSATPSATTRPSGSEPTHAPVGDLAVRLVHVGDVEWIYPVAQLTVMTDGQVVTPPTETSPTWQRRALTADGVDAVVQRVTGTGLFAASAEFPMLHRPGAPDWPGMGGSQITITLGHAADQVVVSGGAWFGDEFEATYNMPSPAREALTELAGALADLSWLPDGAWRDAEPVPYVPATQLLITSWQLGGVGGGPAVDDVAWPFDGPLAEFGEALRRTSTEMLRCGAVDAAAADAIVTELNRLTGTEPPAGEYNAQLRADVASVELYLRPQLPDGFPGCAELMVGGV